MSPWPSSATSAPAGVSGPGRRSSPRGCALLCPVWGCTCGVVYPWPLPPLPGRVCRAAGSCGMADGAENGHTQSAHPALGGSGVGGGHHNAPRGSTSMDVSDGSVPPPVCPERGWGQGRDPPALTCSGPFLLRAGAAGQTLLVVLLLLGSDPLHPGGTGCCRARSPRPPGPSHTQATPVQGEGSQCPPKPTHCRFSWSSDLLSDRRCERRLFMMLALNSATPLGDRDSGGSRRGPQHPQ